jgi:parallel beta-helix repeat protein
MKTARLALFAALVAAALPGRAAPPAGGAIGIVEINQDKAVAGNVTPGDTGGFPVTLSQRGSYRLTSNLTVPPGSTSVPNGIHITADDVTLDLNGFAIVSDGCSGTPLSCNGWGAGIVAQDIRTGVTVMNGTVRGMPAGAVFLGSGRIERMQIIGNLQGITMKRGVVSNNVVQGNQGLGIWLVETGSVIGNTALDNGSLGIFFGGQGGWAHNVLAGNNSGGVQVQGGTALGGNFCSYSGCP